MTQSITSTGMYCPYCDQTLLESFLLKDNDWRVRCKTCGAIGPTASSEFGAIELWNTRRRAQWDYQEALRIQQEGDRIQQEREAQLEQIRQYTENRIQEINQKLAELQQEIPL